MKRDKMIDISFRTQATSFVPFDRNEFAKAVCSVDGKCTQRNLHTLAGEIAHASGCVQHHFGIPQAQAVPLVAQAVGSIQLVQSLGGNGDPEDAIKWMDNQVELFDKYLDSVGAGTVLHGEGANETHSRAELWQFVSRQAIAVLRGEFSQRVTEADEALIANQ